MQALTPQEEKALIQAERGQNLKVLLMLRVRFGVFQHPTHPTLPHDHQDAEDKVSQGFCEGSPITYRQIFAPKSSLRHYLEVVVYAPMRSTKDPDYNALLAYQAFNGMDWAGHECMMSEVLGRIENHHWGQERTFLASLTTKCEPCSGWSDRDTF